MHIITRGTSRAGILALVIALLTALVLVPTGPAAADTTPTDDPAEAAAGWLVSALTDDPAVGSEFGPSSGPTIDVLFALAATGVAADTIEAMADWLTSDAAVYTQGSGFDAEDAAYAGATAKLALAMQVVERDPTDVDGIDLLAQLEELEGTGDGPAGRFSDRGEFDDFSTPLTQSLALLALTRAEDREPSAAAVEALTSSACPDGGFPDSFAGADDPDTCTGGTDTTALAVQALVAVGADEPARAAVDWLLASQADDGSFGSVDGANTNSSGLAAAALALLDEQDAAEAAIAWTLDLQAGCDSDNPGAIAFSADEDGALELATAQAVVGASAADLATLTAGDATTDVPALDCDELAADGDEGNDEGATDEVEEVEEPDADDADEADEEATEEAEDTEDAAVAADEDGGFPTWGALLLAAVVAGAIALFVRARRNGGTTDGEAETA